MPVSRSASPSLWPMRPLLALQHPRQWSYERTRVRIAERHLRGAGIEIGALHSPFPAPEAAQVTYVDRMTTDELRDEYPELGDAPLAEVDVVDDGERLATFDAASVDFVIASHFLEHCEDPIGTLEAHLRVLRPGGTLLLALPDRRLGIDRHRPPTSLDHLVSDHQDGGRSSRAAHYLEWANLVDLPLGNIDREQAADHAADLERRRYSIHFHCWTGDEFREQLEQLLPRLETGAALAQLRRNHHDFIALLRRC